MKIFICICSVFLLFSSCKDVEKLNAESLKTGTFTTYLDDSDAVSTATRNDSIQIETYNTIKDTFHIEWKSNFE